MLGCLTPTTSASADYSVRRLDFADSHGLCAYIKVRLAPKLAKDAFGFRPEHVGRLLILPDTSATRGVVRRHETTMSLI